MTTATQTSTPKALLRDFRPISLKLEEDKGTGRVRVRGEFARADLPTENRRVYGRGLWEREIGRMNKSVSERKVMGELDHPADGRTQLSRVSHIITGLELGQDGLVVGEAEILDTDRGRNLKALLQSGARIGVSSRGYGSVKSDDKGNDVVQEDYRLLTFDFVADPADSNAYPDVFFEGKEFEMSGLKTLTEAELRTERPDLIESVEKAAVTKAAFQTEATVRSSLEETFQKNLAEAVEKSKEEIRENVRGELLSDPAVAGAKAALEKVRSVLRPFILPEDAEAVVRKFEEEIVDLKKQIAERDAAVVKANAERDEAVGIARIAGYRFYLENAISGDPNAARIREAVGDVKSYTNSEAIKAKIDEVRTVLKQEEDRQNQIETEKRKISEEKDAEIAVLNGKLEELQKATTGALETAREMALKVYIAERLAKHPNADQARALIEAANPKSKEQVDKLFEQVRSSASRASSPEAVEQARTRVRDLTKGGISEETPSREDGKTLSEDVDNFLGLGAPLSELKRLSGVK
jgi:hypothetical protein